MAHRVKKLMDRKGISRLRNLQINGSESTKHTSPWVKFCAGEGGLKSWEWCGDVATLEEAERMEFAYPTVIESSDGRVHINYNIRGPKVRYDVFIYSNEVEKFLETYNDHSDTEIASLSLILALKCFLFVTMCFPDDGVLVTVSKDDMLFLMGLVTRKPLKKYASIVSWSSPHWADGSLSEHDRVMLCHEAAIEKRTSEVETYATSGNLDYLDSILKGIHETMRSNQEHGFGLQKKETLNIRHSQSHEGRSDSASTNKLKIRTCICENGLSIADATMLHIKSATYDLNLMKSDQKEAISNLHIATKDDDIEEVAALNDEAEASEAECQTKQHDPMNPIPDPSVKEESGPFGLDALIPNAPKKMKK
nr:hypothetical protein [Tanacetum cinerariifolium]